MPTNIVEASEFTTPVAVPANGDARTAASVAAPFQAITNRTKKLRDWLLLLDSNEDGAVDCLIRPPAGKADAGTASIKLTTGTLNTKAEAGALEFASKKLYFTPDATRLEVSLSDHDHTGTTSATFQLDSTKTGAKLKNVSGTVAVRNEADNADAPVTCSVMTASSQVVGPRAMITPEGGYAVLMTNKTGHSSVKGEIVVASASTDNAVDICPANTKFPIGVVYNSGVAADSNVWVVVAGRAQVLLKDETAATHGLWIGTCSVEGRVECVADPISGGKHEQECGHCCETVSAGGPGVPTLAYAILHFN